MSTIKIPHLSLVALIGPSGAGKSTFARQHFLPTEVISSDFCRGLVGDDENDQTVTGDAFDVLYFIAAKRLAAGRFTVVDATNVRPEDRKRLIALAREYHVLPAAIVFDLPERVYHERNAARTDRDFGSHVIRSQVQTLHRSMRGLERDMNGVVAALQGSGSGAPPATEINKGPFGPDFVQFFEMVRTAEGQIADVREHLGREAKS